MSSPLADYGVIGDLHTAALVSRHGSIDWLCLPRFDSGACFAALLGDAEHGRWLLAPAGWSHRSRQRYRADTLVLETEFECPTGTVRVVDAMPITERWCDVVRIVEGVAGEVAMASELILRFDYGQVVPWLRHDSERTVLEAGPDTVVIDADVQHEFDDSANLTARFTVHAGDRVGFRLGWFGIGEHVPAQLDPVSTVDKTEAWWRTWAEQCTATGDHRDAVVRSLITLKALTYSPSGGIVAALTASLPEQLGGDLNWDYRFCWLRDAAYTVMALLDSGYEAEAVAWRDWLLRALAGRPERLQVMYAVDGARRLPETEADWLPGYAQSTPVRLGNAAHGQLQLDVYGEVMDMLHQCRIRGLEPGPHVWEVQCDLLEYLESCWQQPDSGIWELRGPRRQYVYSKAMCWVAFDRGIRAVEGYGLHGPVERWREVRARISAEVCDKGWNNELGSFTQFYGSWAVDGALLRLAPVGFLPADDPRITGTVAAVERVLLRDGLVHRTSEDGEPDELDSFARKDSSFIACSLWLADNYLLAGRTDEAAALFQRVSSLRNDLGLLSEEFDSDSGRLVGNFPQAFSHVPLVTTALALTDASGPNSSAYPDRSTR